LILFLSGNRSRPATQSSGISAIKESADSNSATIDDVNDVERIDRLSKKHKIYISFFFVNNIK
jgi:hypothetical protein